MTARLVATARAHWLTLDGYAVAHNMGRLEDLEVSRFNSFVYWWFTHDLDANQLAKFRARLFQPPKGFVAPANSLWSADNERNSLRAFASQMGRAAGAR